MRAISILLLVLVGCQSDADQPTNVANATVVANNTVSATNNAATNNARTNNTGGNTSPATNGTGCGEPAEVTFQTSDDVTIAADFHPAATANRGAVVLLHMIPPNWDRTSYPPRVRNALAALDLNVLNIDRRGAGDSTGVARDAYQGAATSLDAEAAVRFLLDGARTCAVDGSRLMLVGASNGTTSVFDYTVGRTDTGLPDPVAIAWLSPGTYTEAQNTLADNPIAAMPLLIVHPENEPWATNLTAPDAWKIVQVAGGQHGTQNFDNGPLEAIQLAELVGWAQSHVAE